MLLHIPFEYIFICKCQFSIFNDMILYIWQTYVRHYLGCNYFQKYYPIYYKLLIYLLFIL